MAHLIRKKVTRKDGVVFHAGDWVLAGGEREEIEAVVPHGVMLKSGDVWASLDRLEHCAPSPLPSVLPPGTEYGSRPRWRIVEEARLSAGSCWVGGRDEFIGDGEDPYPDSRYVYAHPETVDWSTYWVAVNGTRVTRAREPFDWEEGERVFAEVLGG